jgi:hypothetical protein
MPVASGHGSHAAYDDDTLKHPVAWNGKVGDDAGHNYTDRIHNAAPYIIGSTRPRDYHHYSTTTTTTLAR